jgi:glutaminase
MPAKSGVGGGILAVSPNQLGIGVFSPLLDPRGNSVRGVNVCTEISRHFGLHAFNTNDNDERFQEAASGKL